MTCLLPVDFEQSVVGGVVAHWDIATLFEPVGDGGPGLRSRSHRAKLVTRFIDEPGPGSRRRGGFKLVEDVGEFRVLRRAVGVDDRPEGGRLGRRRFRVEARKVGLG